MNENTGKKTGKNPKKPGRPENLLPPWQPGQSGNPNGHPKGLKNRTTIARKIISMNGMLPKEIMGKLKDMYPEIDKRMSVEEIMTIIMSHRAITKGDVSAYNAVMDSAYGKAKQNIEVGEKGDFEDLSDEELAAEIEQLREEVSKGGKKPTDPGEKTPAGRKKKTM